MVGSARLQGTREQFQRAGNNLEKAEPQQSGAVQQKTCWGLGEEALQASPAFQMLISKSREAPGKKGDLGSELQRDRSSEETQHLLIQCLSHWDVLHGLIASAGAAWGHYSTGTPGQRQGDLSREDSGDVPPCFQGAGHREAASCTCRTHCPTP